MDVSSNRQDKYLCLFSPFPSLFLLPRIFRYLSISFRWHARPHICMCMRSHVPSITRCRGKLFLAEIHPVIYTLDQKTLNASHEIRGMHMWMRIERIEASGESLIEIIINLPYNPATSVKSRALASACKLEKWPTMTETESCFKSALNGPFYV